MFGMFDKRKFTVACDISPYPYPHITNNRESLMRVAGLRKARRLARHWCRRHPSGQARIVEGWRFWPDETVTYRFHGTEVIE